MTAQLLLGISILVGIHEAGHMYAAKYFGMRVEKFAIGFPPKLFSFRIGETEYSLGALPLGGFVKITGMVDESLDTEQLKKDPEPYEFRAKPAWQRLIVMLGGIIVNVITGVLVFVALTFWVGERFTPVEEVNKHGLHVNALGETLGFQSGDKIVSLSGTAPESFEDALDPNFLLEPGNFYEVQRGQENVKIPIDENFISTYTSERAEQRFIQPRMPYTVGRVAKGRAGDKAGLQEGDKILSINGEPVPYFQNLPETLAKFKNQEIAVQIQRDGVEKVLKVQLGEDGLIGFAPDIELEEGRRNYGFGEAVVRGTGRAFGIVWVNIKAFGMIFNGTISAKDSVGGPIEIARKFYGGTFNWLRFWTITGMLSMILAFMNLLPIPALDGGHVVFLLYEIIAGRAPSEKFMEAAQKVGMIILLGLMVLIFGKDIYMLIVEKFLN